MDIVLAPLYFVFAHTFLGTAIFLVIGYYLVRAVSKLTGPLPELARNYGFLILCAAAFLKVFFGHDVAVRLVHALGQDAPGVVVDSYPTATVYNGQQVTGYHVLLALADGRTVQESFRTDSFNVYPPHNMTTYPSEGDHFDARYLPHFPSAFIILANEGGGFAQNLRCDTLRRSLHADEVKLQFAPHTAQFRSDTLGALRAYLDARCEITPQALQDDREELQELQQTPANPSSVQH